MFCLPSTSHKEDTCCLSFRFFDFLMEQALKKVLLEYVRAMLNKYAFVVVVFYCSSENYELYITLG